MMQLRKVVNHPYLFDGVEEDCLPDFGDHLLEHSAKLKFVDKLLIKQFAQGNQVLIFSQFTTMLDILEDFC